MKGIEMPKSHALPKRFESLYQAEITELDYDDLPPSIRDRFEKWSSSFILPEHYRERNFSKLLCFTHVNDDITYVAQQDKLRSNTGKIERLTYFIDTREGEETGYLELVLVLDDVEEYFKDKPFVGFTRTLGGYYRQGLARRRLEQANAYSLSEHGKPLYSDTNIGDVAKRVWERLVEEGVAEKFEEEGHDRYRFVVS